MLEEIDEAEAVIAHSNITPKGEIKLSAPLWIANTQFMGLLEQFRQSYPEVTFDIDISGRFVDIVEEGFDLALRASRTIAPSLIARQLTQMPFKVVVAPRYLTHRIMPTQPQDLAQLQVLSYSLVNHQGMVRLNGPEGEISIQMASVMSSNNEFILYQAALQGMGVGILPDALVSQDLARGK